MPRLEIEMVPPWNSAGCSLLSRAFAASSLTFWEISRTPLRSAPNTMGVMRPLSVDTATETSTSLYSRMKVPIHAEFASGTLRQAVAMALMMKSLMETRAPCFSYFLFTWARNLMSCKEPECRISRVIAKRSSRAYLVHLAFHGGVIVWQILL